jgi:chemotaxis protein CheZ
VSDKANSSGDSDELQALFDSIVSAGGSEPDPTPSPAPAASVADTEPVSAQLEDTGATSSAGQMDDPARSMFASIGQLTRKVHDALRELGYDKSLEKAAFTIPDARDRLAYVATLTEQAANRTLNAVDVAQPLQNKIESETDALAAEWEKLFANQLSVDEFKQLAHRTRDYLKSTGNNVRATNEQLLEIMMAQDFQDLTGQVIKKIVEMAKEMEAGLLEFLVQFSTSSGAAPKAVAATQESTLENGPAYKTEGRTDVVTSQEQVDDLLASLGF